MGPKHSYETAKEHVTAKSEPPVFRAGERTRKDLIANAVIKKLNEWIFSTEKNQATTVMWRNELEVCDIMGVQRDLSFESASVMRSVYDAHEPDKCIVIYNLLPFPISVNSEFLPGTIRELKSFNFGLNASATDGGANFGLEYDDKALLQISSEKMIVLPHQMNLIQVGNRIVSYLTVDAFFAGIKINMYTDKKMYYSQALIVGGDAKDAFPSEIEKDRANDWIDYQSHFVRILIFIIFGFIEY